MKINVIAFSSRQVGVIQLSLAEPNGVGGLGPSILSNSRKGLTEEGLFQDRWKQALQFPKKDPGSSCQSSGMIRDIIQQ